MAEKAAWDFRESLPEADRFDIVVLNPALILGPAFQTLDFWSGDSIRKLMTSGQPVPRTRFGMVDIRDVAQAHMTALENAQAANKRFILVS